MRTYRILVEELEAPWNVGIEVKQHNMLLCHFNANLFIFKKGPRERLPSAAENKPRPGGGGRSGSRGKVWKRNRCEDDGFLKKNIRFHVWELVCLILMSELAQNGPVCYAKMQKKILAYSAECEHLRLAISFLEWSNRNQNNNRLLFDQRCIETVARRVAEMCLREDRRVLKATVRVEKTRATRWKNKNLPQNQNFKSHVFCQEGEESGSGGHQRAFRHLRSRICFFRERGQIQGQVKLQLRCW